MFLLLSVCAVVSGFALGLSAYTWLGAFVMGAAGLVYSRIVAKIMTFIWS
ncbi:MAG TPA: hypothetical protein VFT51_06970 [Bacillales bacterium]|nr:hypothetical protein [Bacillales bacterium]